MAAAESTIVEIQEPAREPSLQQILSALPEDDTTTQKFTIYKVPAHIREKRKIYFEPRMISIGPYHHGKSHLQGMEKYKALYLRDFLLRSNIALESYLRVIKMQLPRIKSCYFESIDQFSDDKFAEMLLLDGCFILELMLKLYVPGVTIFEAVHWMHPLIICDLLMLENQIPFFVLQSLFDHIKLSLGGEIPNFLVEVLIIYLMDGNVKGSGFVADTEIYHLLHLYHYFYVSKQEFPVLDKKPLFSGLRKALKLVAVATTAVTYFSKKKEGSITERTPRAVPSATKLHEIGVKFMKKDTTNLFDITFKNGILEIPFLSLDYTTLPQISNLVAFEQSIPGAKGLLTSYVEFMDHIIDTPKDVSILVTSGILEHMLTSNEEAASFFNHLAEYTYLDYDKHYLAGLYKDVNRYCASSWHEWRAKLMRDYFSSPWAVLSFGAAVVLLILTFLPTFFAIYAYFRPGT